MLRLVARFFITTMTPRSLIRLGELLVEAGKAAEARLVVVEKALQSVRAATQTLTEK